MLTSAHFIWLAIIATTIALLLILVKRFALSEAMIRKTVLIILVILKIFHLSLSMKSSPDGGFVIDQTQLSFHLCSIMIYAVIFINIIKNERIVRLIKSFMAPCMLIGAAMALLIPTEGVDIGVLRVWQYMLIHGVLVFYGLYLMLVERVDLSFGAYVTNLKLLTVVVLVAFLMNSVLEQYHTNFLFLRKPPMEGLPILNLDHGWYVYFVVLTLVACTLLFLVHLPFVLRDMRRNRTSKRFK